MPKDGLGDEHCYALACDTQGRIWAGHQSHGVSVFNGQKWQNYEVVAGLSRPDSLNGPLGERIFDIAVCPTDGDVWMATSLGLARYRLQAGDWQYFTRMEGLPSDQIQAIAFDRKGRIYAGTQCDGLAMADGSEYRKWRTINENPQAFLQGIGEGLPTDLINDVLVGSDGTIWVATNFGLAISRNRGNTWRYVRGKDYAAKVEGLIDGAPKGWEKPTPEELEPLLAEDYVTCLAEGWDGSIWIGHRKAGFESRTPRTGEVIKTSAASEIKDYKRHPLDGYISSLLPSSATQMIVGRYVQGLTVAGLQGEEETREAAMPPTVPRHLMPGGDLFPVPAKALNLEHIGQLVAKAELWRQPRQGAVAAAVLDEDWSTKGDWVGRYGRNYNVLCATMSPFDQRLVWNNKHEVDAQIGPKFVREGNTIRCWIHWVKTDNPNTLYNPVAGVRRQSEWDDNGEAYSSLLDGPDIWVKVKVPKGIHRLSAWQSASKLRPLSASKLRPPRHNPARSLTL